MNMGSNDVAIDWLVRHQDMIIGIGLGAITMTAYIRWQDGVFTGPTWLVGLIVLSMWIAAIMIYVR